MSYFSMSWGDLMDEEDRLRDRNAIERVKDELTDVISFRNQLRNTAPDDTTFQEMMNKRLAESLEYLEVHKEPALQDDEVSYWKTRGLICMESATFANEAANALSKVVQLNPADSSCWNYLGETYCALKNWELGKKCFLIAMDREKNPVSLQDLSMWCRVKGKKEPSDVQQGIKYAKDALAFDFSNGKSWTILGNAYMAAFFATQQSEKYVSKALYAYRQAEKGDPEDVDVCANKFLALRFLEYYEEALRTLLPAFTRSELDWRMKRADYENLLGYLKSVQELVDKKGKLRTKRLAEFSQRLKQQSKPGTSKGAPIPGPDGDKRDQITGIIIFILNPDESYPYTLGILTETKDINVATVYNLRSDKGFKIGDVMRIPKTNTNLVDFTINNSIFKFAKTRIYMPTQIELNGKRLTPTFVNPMTIVSS